MKIVLATGIYPPDIGGPATYVQALAQQLTAMGEEVVVVTYGDGDWGLGIGDWGFVARCSFFVSRFLRLTSYALRLSLFSHFPSRHALCSEQTEAWSVLHVAKNGGPLLRWWRYGRALRKVGRDADVVVAFSSVSAGVPLTMSRLKKPKRVLRLGGDFLWERYTDGGGMMGLREWYEERTKTGRFSLFVVRWIMRRLLGSFDSIVFSTQWQEELYERVYTRLPAHSVIENALPKGKPVQHGAHTPFRLLFLGRFVAFKHLLPLIDALAGVPEATLTLAGSGPVEAALRTQAEKLVLRDRVTFLPPQAGAAKQRVFSEHDLLVIPSITEISPNAALEARAMGLPVLLTSETGLSVALTQGMMLRELCTPQQIASAVREARDRYASLSAEAAAGTSSRGWKEVAQEWRHLLFSLA